LGKLIPKFYANAKLFQDNRYQNGPIRFARVSFGHRNEADTAISNLRGRFNLNANISKPKNELEERRRMRNIIYEENIELEKVNFLFIDLRADARI